MAFGAVWGSKGPKPKGFLTEGDGGDGSGPYQAVEGRREDGAGELSGALPGLQQEEGREVTGKRRITEREKAAWRYLLRIALLWLFALGAVGSVFGAMLGEREMAATLPISLFLFVVLWRGGPKSADFLPRDDNADGVDGG